MNECYVQNRKNITMTCNYKRVYMYLLLTIGRKLEHLL